MEPGQMLAKLHEAEDALPDLLREGVDTWESLDINYQPPHVKRLWRQWGDYRINLHYITSCEEALVHPHPWPSAIRVITGVYEMGIGYSEPGYRPVEVARVVLRGSDQYEMVHPHGWHYVKPLYGSSLSVMVTGKPFDPQPFDHDDFGKRATLRALPPDQKAELHAEFVAEYHYWRRNR